MVPVPPPREPDEFEPGCSRRGWQHEAASRTEMVHRDTWIMPRLTDDERAMLRSQSGPGSGLAFSSVPASACPTELIPITSECCCCADFVSPFSPVSQGHLPVWPSPSTLLASHRAVSAAELPSVGQAGLSSGELLSSDLPRGSVQQSLDECVGSSGLCSGSSVAPNAHDARRLEIVAEGLPLYGGAQLAVDTTLVSAHHCDGTARLGAAHIDGAALVVARRRKERAYPELVGPRSRAKLVVLAGEVGGRWSCRDGDFLEVVGRRPCSERECTSATQS